MTNTKISKTMRAVAAISSSIPRLFRYFAFIFFRIIIFGLIKIYNFFIRNIGKSSL